MLTVDPRVHRAHVPGGDVRAAPGRGGRVAAAGRRRGRAGVRPRRAPQRRETLPGQSGQVGLAVLSVHYFRFYLRYRKKETKIVFGGCRNRTGV